MLGRCSHSIYAHASVAPAISRVAFQKSHPGISSSLVLVSARLFSGSISFTYFQPSRHSMSPQNTQRDSIFTTSTSADKISFPLNSRGLSATNSGRPGTAEKKCSESESSEDSDNMMGAITDSAAAMATAPAGVSGSAAAHTDAGSEENTICWTPPRSLLLTSHMTRFARYVANRRGLLNLVTPLEQETPPRSRRGSDRKTSEVDSATHDSTPESNPVATALEAKNSATKTEANVDGIGSNYIANYRELHKYSVEHINLFWYDVIKYCEVVYSAPPVAFLKHKDELICPYDAADQNTVGTENPAVAPRVPDSLRMDDFPTWFPGMQLNFAENLLRYARRPESASIPAVYAATEDSPARVAFTFAELRTRVEEMATALRVSGVKPGDRVAAYMATCPEALVALLATAAVGAVWCSTSPDFGVTGVLERFAQVRPKILLAVNGVMYNEKLHGQLAKLQQIVSGIREIPEAAAELTDVVVLPFRRECDMDITGIPLATTWAEFIRRGASAPSAKSGEQFEYTQLPFGHPLYIVFSSGTTGKPKGIIHSAGGSLVQHLKELVIHGNLGVGDAYLQYTTTGWMMWQWMVSALACGCAVVTYDGSPLRPTPDVMLQVIQDANVTVFGTSAKYVQSLADSVYGSSPHDLVALLAPNFAGNVKKTASAASGARTAHTLPPAPASASRLRARSPREFELSKLHSIYTTGSPLAPTSFDFVYSHFSRDLHDAPMLSSITGGTDILSLFIGMNTNLPVRRGQLQSVCLGMAVEAWDEPKNAGAASSGAGADNYSLRVADGTPGDLVCTKLFPSMPIGFWNDDPQKHTMYRNAYFNKFPHVWAHGDFLSFCRESNGVVMLGRSDGTLNPAGVRFGSSELYNIVENFVEFSDSLAVGQKLRDTEDERVCLFLVMAPDYELTEELVERLRARIRTQLSSRHVPAFIAAVDDIPYTINGKKVEVAVKRLISGEVVTASGTLRNPDSLQQFMRIPELRIPQARKL